MNNPPLRRYLKQLLSEPPLRLGMRTVLRIAHRVSPGNPEVFRWAANFDALPYTTYAVGLLVAAEYAARARKAGFTAVEFGVAGGNGLLALSRYAKMTAGLTGLNIQVVGFDAGAGLPESEDLRDAPWLWNPGDFPCDLDLLRRQLSPGTDLIVGRIEETFPPWLRSSASLPVGFIAVDVDYYSSAKAICTALGNAPTSSILPMIECYFDDCLRYLVPRRAGEAAAVDEFNSVYRQRFFDRDDWLSEGRPFADRLWLRRMYTLYSLDHPSLRSQVSRDRERLDLLVS